MDVLTYVLSAEGTRVLAFVGGWVAGIVCTGILALVIEP